MSLTPRGAALLGGGLALTVAGLVMIDGAMMAIGVGGLITLVFTLILGRWNLAKLEGEIEAPERVFADQQFDFRLHLKNGRELFDAHGIEMRLFLSEKADIHSHAKWTAARSTSTVKLNGSIPTRGALINHGFILTSVFPLGLLKHKKTTSIQKEILVFPKALLPKEFFATGEFDDAWLGDGLQSGDAPGEPRGLRPLRPGDPAKNIHWPATMRAIARGRLPRVRENDPPGLRPRRATVIFHSFATDGTLIRTDYFERALSLLCGTLQHLRRIGVPADLCADFKGWRAQPTFQNSAWSETLTLLARAERVGDTEAHDLAAFIESVPPENALLLVSDMPPEAWASILPERAAVVVDVRQHRFAHKHLNFRKTNELPPKRHAAPTAS